MRTSVFLTVALLSASVAALPAVAGEARDADAARVAAPASENGGHSRQVYYGIGNGGETFRTTVTGGNAGGYTNRN